MFNSAIDLLKSLREKGYLAYFAGGCVRDMLLGQAPQDFDIVTSARPEEIEALFEHTVAVGKQFGVILVIHQGHHYEVATFRSDSGNSDGRRPDSVIFTDAQSDALRRDFTINGMFYDPIKEEVLDYVGGERDLQEKLLRFIGNPTHRIHEDHLRILRAIRFKNQFGLQYEPETFRALLELGPGYGARVSSERIGKELSKMLLSPKPSLALEDLDRFGLLSEVLPELKATQGCAQPAEYHQEGDVWEHTLRAVDSLDENATLTSRWATLLHDIGKPETYSLKERIRFDGHARVSTRLARRLLNRLKYSSKFIDSVTWSIEHHMMMVPLMEMNEGRRATWYLHPDFPILLDLMRADASGTIPTDLSLYQQIYDQFRLIKAKHQDLPVSLLNGHQIMNLLKIPAGPKISEIKNRLLELQIEGKISTLEEAEQWLISSENNL